MNRDAAVAGENGRDDRIVFDDVSKFYGEVLGVNRVRLSLPPGITGLVGPNGSGKTTLMNLMVGLLRPSRGTVRVLGMPTDRPEALFRRVGYATQYDAFPPGLTGYQLIESLLRFGSALGPDFSVTPPGESAPVTPRDVAQTLANRLIALFKPDAHGCRPCYGGTEKFQRDPHWRDYLQFHEYFHGDNGAGLGASHQTGWTGLVADIIRRRHGGLPTVGEIIARVMRDNPTA